MGLSKYNFLKGNVEGKAKKEIKIAYLKDKKETFRKKSRIFSTVFFFKYFLFLCFSFLFFQNNDNIFCFCQLSNFISTAHLKEAVQIFQQQNLIPFKSAFDVYTYNLISSTSNILERKLKDELNRASCNFLKTKMTKETKIEELNYVFLSLTLVNSCDVPIPKSVSAELKKAFNEKNDVASSLFYYSTFPLIYIFKSKPKLSVPPDFVEKAKNILLNMNNLDISKANEERMKVLSKSLYATANIIKHIPNESEFDLCSHWLKIFKIVLEKSSKFFLENKEKHLDLISTVLRSFFLIGQYVAENSEKQKHLIPVFEEIQNSNSNFVNSMNSVIQIFQNSKTMKKIQEAYPILHDALSYNFSSIPLWGIKVHQKNKVEFCNLMGNKIEGIVQIFVENAKNNQKEEMNLINKESSSPSKCTYTTKNLEWTNADTLKFVIKIENKIFNYTTVVEKKKKS